MTRVNPGAWLYVNDRFINPTQANGLTALSDLQVTWGREDLYAQPEAGTASVSVWDPTGTWGTQTDAVGQTDIVGTIADAGWTEPDGTLRRFFRGRVSTVAVQPWRLGGVDGAMVHLGLVSRLADPAALTNTAAWPLDGPTQRRDLILPLLNSATAGAVTAVTRWNEGLKLMRYRAAGDRTLLQGLTDIYTSGAVTMSYLPDLTTVRGIRRGVFDLYPTTNDRRGLAGLTRDTTGDRAGKGAFIATRPLPIADAGSAGGGAETSSPMWLADGIAPDSEWASRAAEARITQTTITFWSAGSGGSTTAPVQNTETAGISRPGAVARTATIDTEAYDNTTGLFHSAGSATDAAFYLQNSLAREGARPVPAPITLDLDYTDGFDTIEQARYFLAGGELPSPVFIQGTAYPRLGIRPVFTIMGGTIEHTDGRWLLTLNLVPVSTVAKQHAVTWPEIDDGTTGNRLKIYTDGLEHADALHASVTCDDLLYCSTGLGVTTPGPDTGWDKLQ